MGQHKHNPVAIAAARGELEPRKKPMGKRESERILMAEIQAMMMAPFVAAKIKMEQQEMKNVADMTGYLGKMSQEGDGEE